MLTGGVSGAYYLALSDTGATAPVSAVGAANVRYNNTTGVLEVSYSGNAYSSLGVAGASFDDLQRKFRLMLKALALGVGHMGLGGLFTASNALGQEAVISLDTI